jgi:cytochrome c556
MFKTRILIASALIAGTAGLALAGGHGGNPAVKARQSHMQLYQHNLGLLGNMAKGEVAYDADTAQAAANNLASLTTLAHVGYWTPGTSNADLGEETRALPALWEAGSKAGEIGGQLAEAAANLASVAGNGQDAIGPALGPVGGACTECHKAYRQSNN